MKYLKEYRLFESVNELEIHSICKEYGITDYGINPDGTIDVDDDVYLSNKGLTKLPLKFNKVIGNFYCYNNKLTSLEGAPQSVGDYFNCNENQLTSLEGAPQSVGVDFSCYKNKLKTLEGAPKSVGGDFQCSRNQLMSLKGAPQSIGNNFYCYENNLTSLEGLEFKSFYYISLMNNPINEIVKDWINNDNSEELIEYFVDLSIIQDNKLIMVRLEAFYEDIGLEMNIDFDEVKKYYKII